MAEGQKEQKLLFLASSPHIVNPANAQGLMRNVLVALAPVTVLGIALYGWHALLVVLVSVVSAEVAEAAFRLITKREARVRDLSAAVTGLLLALVLPPGLPLWMVALGAVFAVVVAKEFFGGLGANVFNPALIGRAFLLTSFPAALTSWVAPGADAVSAATPLSVIKLGADNPALEDFIRQGLTAGDGAMWLRLFLGNHAGSIGETSALLILIGGIFLALTKTIDLRAPLAMIGSAFILSAILGLDPVYGILTGGLLFGAVFMATDYVSAPVTETGKIIFGIGCGIITVLIRTFGSYPEGVMYSILIMNAATPHLNKILHKKYGWKPKPKAVAAGGAK
ncbi:MAG: RnfABCDGE type electron transport complex subunit D [Spirochaetaceae bacterium]|jgi:electron transport complex protein RnfD|nr:RnfABCDGE type electron transport complex subunit D [Spirochaetaceae bacterium]